MAGGNRTARFRRQFAAVTNVIKERLGRFEAEEEDWRLVTLLEIAHGALVSLARYVVAASSRQRGRLLEGMPKETRMVRAAIVVTLWLTASPAVAAVLCTGKMGSGTLRVRAACKLSEVQVDPVSLGLQGPPGAVGPGLVVKDANGAAIGAVIEEATSYTVGPILNSVGELIGFQHTSPPPFFFHLMQVGRKIAGTQVRLTVSPDDFVPIGPTSGILFDGPDCTGQAYFDTGSAGSPLLRPRFLEQGWVNGSALYYRPHGSATTTFTQRSRLTIPAESSPGCPAGSQSVFIPPAGRCCTDGSTYIVEGQVVSMIDVSTLGLVPPFHVEGP